MVAIIKDGYSIRRSFLYNENKLERLVAVENGGQRPAAELLIAANYPMELPARRQNHRLNMLLKQAALGPEVNKNSVHITLNFAAGESFDHEKLRCIATEYMEAIGFGSQPYLLYQHHDAGHPHLHLVTTKVNANGVGIPMHNIQKNQSYAACRMLEKKYDLVSATAHKREVFRLKPVSAARIQYGHAATKQAIGATLEYLLSRYHFGSLTELNALLNRYNILADTGSEGSRIQKKGGLVYRVLDNEGRPVSAPVKASLLHFKPTLSKLRTLFTKGKIARGRYADPLRTVIDSVLKSKATTSTSALKSALKSKGIELIEHYGNQGRLYGLTYIDHRNKCVFNGSDLGKAYSANMVSSLLASSRITDKSHQTNPPTPLHLLENDVGKNLWDLLTEPLTGADYVPFELRPRKKKRRKNRPNNLT